MFGAFFLESESLVYCVYVFMMCLHVCVRVCRPGGVRRAYLYALKDLYSLSIVN